MSDQQPGFREQVQRGMAAIAMHGDDAIPDSLPCPFCGSNEIISIDDEETGESFMECRGCGAQGGPGKEEDGGYLVALLRWNCRA